MRQFKKLTRTSRLTRLSLPLAAVFLALSSLVWTNNTFDTSIAAEDRRPTIAIDPGHGGSDKGAANESGGLEKEISLMLSQILYNRLNADYRVVLTRNEDFSPDLFERTQTANQAKADVFISLHVGGSPMPQAKGATVFFYHAPASVNDSSGPETENDDSGITPTQWNQAQWRHLSKSRELAAIISQSLGKHLDAVEVETRGAPLAVLAGANMPAVVIEIGYLSHPREGQDLKQREKLDIYASSISVAIREFLSVN